MDLQVLKIFQMVAKMGSISKAARELNYAQSNISTKIQQLESYMETSLFYRHNRGVTLSVKGHMLLKYTEKIFRLIDETTSAVKEDNIPRGPLRIGSMETTAAVHLPKLLSIYHKNYPNVDLTLKTGTTEKNIREILEYNLDGAFVMGPINHPELVQKTVFDENLVFITDTAQPAISSMGDIQTRTLLVFPVGCSYRKILEQLLYNEGLIPNKIIEFDSLGAIISSVCSGLGVTLLPLSVVERYVQAGTLKCHTIQNLCTSVPTVFIYRKDKFMSSSLIKFMDIFGNEL
ncbi:MAG: LysR family transcriptional regulator [Clostridium sp.]|jgi:DNA-binding transcriptional LysR family regulator|uniref:LysR family transcriptional regulator n=1 Tax=Clostridium sp. TaxID=1506 RepID=UPI0025B9923F|nr:LysR family transcriptional regulator [Clostridium sp.]MCH3963271.1 LysR family transcriptional regulator [Clostridium sp.]MCI1717344.1 LysR family transcriptional regulator [Clostridium sp.]MCI1801684.1 LysR family transcriptional regulator [Clostridium sp.]MCI1815530.1 LysR family transcriptional regulator [Clostridium sp.]MCI1872433.1 LysR family transcriptional regulator [Clostridium sp.]